MAYENVNQVLAALKSGSVSQTQAEAEIARLTQPDDDASPQLSFKVGPRGTLVVKVKGKIYPLLSAYRDQAEALFDLDMVGKVHQFLKDNPDVITRKQATVQYGPAKKPTLPQR